MMENKSNKRGGETETEDPRQSLRTLPETLKRTEWGLLTG